MGIIESLASARLGVERACARLSAPRTYAKVGLIAGGGLLGTLLLRRVVGLWGRSKPAPVAAAGRVGTPVSALLVQALTVLVFPWLRARLMGGSWGEALKGIQPSRFFFRWLGLEK